MLFYLVIILKNIILVALLTQKILLYVDFGEIPLRHLIVIS